MPNNAPKQILLVEDNAQDVEITLTLMRNCGVSVEVTVARDGAEALDYLYQRGAYAARPPGLPSLVLLDLKMPKVSGLEVLRELKSHDKLKRLPIVMLTSSRETQDLRDCYHLGANGYVVKPVDVDQFMQAIQNLSAYWVGTNEPPP